MKKTGSFKRLKIENSKKGDDRETRSIIKQKLFSKSFSKY